MKFLTTLTIAFLITINVSANVLTVAGSIDNDPEYDHRYKASTELGYIGISCDRPVDSPSDNVFTVAIDRPIGADEVVWLSYELYGIVDHTGISRSINDQMSVGGQLVTLKPGWSMQKEQISASWLKEGANTIRFTIPRDADYSYQVRNLSIATKKPIDGGRQLVVNQPENHPYSQDIGYLKGFVMGKGDEEVLVSVSGIEVPTQNGEFELLVPKNGELPYWSVQVRARFANGETLSKEVYFVDPIKRDVHNSFGPRVSETTTVRYNPDEIVELSLQGAEVKIPEGVLPSATQVSMARLRQVDLPTLDGTLENVTQNGGGFRVMAKVDRLGAEAAVGVHYDETLIPEGYTAQDIKTFYFDRSTKNWIALKKDSVDLVNKVIYSKIFAFNDLINGVIKVPESPETAGFTPTSIKDIKAADPSAAVVTIEPPSANAMGTANMGYPIKLPAGRQGMQPQLAVHYNSGGGNGWLGQGWSLQTPAISVETRWGVPRYDDNLETETYLMSGQQLYPVAHRTDWLPREADKVFHMRVEGSFNRIIRKGSAPENYWWEVTDKSGTVYSYGGSEAAGGVVDDAVLYDASGNIAHWALVEVRDTNLNTVNYTYDKIMDYGVANGTVEGYNTYIDKITYTGHSGQQGPYEVRFLRDRDLDGAARKDVIINARYGFKQVIADLLKKIEVSFNGEAIRSYELEYIEGAFFKTLLSELIEYDATGQEFTRHGFDYFNDVNGADNQSFRPLTTQDSQWNPQNNEVSSKFLNPLEHFNADASVLGANKSGGGGAALAVTAGILDGNMTAKSNTAGISVGGAWSKNEGLLALVDINGDNLPDKIFKNDEGLFFVPNISGPSENWAFGDEPLPLGGISNFSKGRSRTAEFGIESHFGVFAGAQYTDTKSITSTYFADVNGDQLIDVVNEGTVYFNRLDENGYPRFSPTSAGTPSPISASGSISPDIIDEDPAELEAAIDQNPLHDVIKVWEAPDNGIIGISGPVQLIEDTSLDRTEYTAADGVRVAIQKAGSELWSTTIAADDYGTKTPNGVDNISVTKGDRIYFRVQSVFDGAFDQVAWSPIITYSEHTDDTVDANNLPIYQYRSADDFILSGPMVTSMPIAGEVSLTGSFTKPITTDEVVIKIVKEADGAQEVIWENTYAWDTEVSESIAVEQTVAQGENYTFVVSANTNVDWAALEWNPLATYTASNDPAVTTVHNDDGDPLLVFHPTVDYQVYNETVKRTLPYAVPQDGDITFTPQPVLADNALTGTLVFSVKGSGTWLGETEIQVTDGVLETIGNITVSANQGDQLFLEYFTDNPLLATALEDTSIAILADNSTVQAGLSSRLSEASLFGPRYRYWGQFAYNGNRERANEPIIESEIKIDEAIENAPEIDLSDAQNADDVESGYFGQGGNDPRTNIFIYMLPDAKSQAYIGYDDLTYVQREVISASRLGEDDILPIDPLDGETVEGTGAKAIKKVSKTKNVNFAVGIGPAGLSVSEGWTFQKYDYMDMNGDSHPDILSKNKIQYTLPSGGLQETAVDHGFGKIHQSRHSAQGFTLGGTFLDSKNQNDTEKSRGTKSSDAENESKIAAGISGNFNQNYDHTEYAWMDINGDGLPDRVYENGNVALNLGYTFADPEPWGYGFITDGNATSYGAGININLFNYSLSVGVGLSRSENDTQHTLQDMNGDGLLDYITDASPLSVAINTGNGFAAPVPWEEADAISEGVSTGESVNGSFTACIPIFAVKFCLNPSANGSRGVSREKVAIRDINGDGYPDFMRSEKDGDLRVYRSTIDRTNLLKGVQRPLGASFEVDYARIGNTYEQPQDVWALASVALHDGFADDGADTMATAFEYENGFYDRHERDFYGFGVVKSHQLNTEAGNSIYRTVVQEFKNDNFYEKGLLEREILQDASEALYTESLNQFELKDIDSGATLTEAFKQSDDGAAFPAATEMNKNFYEGQGSAGKTTGMTYAYDALGNVTSYTDFGDTNGNDDISSSISYHSLGNSETGAYIVGIPERITVTGNGQTYRKRETDIDAKGNLTQIRKYLETGGASTYDMEYDVFGNLTQMTRPVNHKGERLSFDYTYDDAVNTYVTQVEDSYGYTSTAEYEYKFGQLLRRTDMNGQPMRYTIDDLGRVTTITGPLELAAGKPYTIAFEYHPVVYQDAPWALTKHYDPAHPGDDLLTSTFIDGLKRVVQVKKDGAIHTVPGSGDEAVMIASGRLHFDAFGRTVKSWYPTAAASAPGTFMPEEDAITATTTQYDVLDRALNVTLPDAAITRTEYGFGTDRDGQTQFSTKVTDANGIWKESYTNVRGLTTAVQELYGQGSNIWTSYAYDPINQLIRVTDDQDNLIESRYDWLGRRTQVDHPDAGTTTYGYDLASNLIQKVTANLADAGQAITYAYDHERLTNMNYPENIQNNVIYTYGAAGAGNNRAGRIVLQEDATGAQEFFYNPLGAVTKNIRTILVPDAEPLTFTTQWQYDTWNRITQMTYPDQETVTYQYNLGGLLHSFRGQRNGEDYAYVQQLGYDKFEQRVYLGYGNGTETFYTYEPERRRLHTMVAETADDRQMMDNLYQYDAVNNILRLQNRAEVPTANKMGGQTDYNYQYDDLYRLTSATGNHIGSDQVNRYTLGMQYNSIHSIVQKSQVHEFIGAVDTEWQPRNKTTYDLAYEYGEAQPHAPLTIGDKAYTYDANGNQTGWMDDISAQERQILWDEENRIKAIADNGEVFSYVYDAGGERVLKSNGGGQNVRVNGRPTGGTGGIGNYTVYVDPYTVVRSSLVTKHYYIESQRVATQLVEDSETLLQPQAGSTTTKQVNYTAKQGQLRGGIAKIYADLDMEIETFESTEKDAGTTARGPGGGPKNQTFLYFYHPDHLGSSSYITDDLGEVSQHVEYFAFGETFFEEHSNKERTPYLFNGKELDEETGLYYYGARYYDAKTSVWQSVDPLWGEVGAHRSPYEYTLSNPINLTDPTGMAPEEDPYLLFNGKENKLYVYDDNDTPDDNSDDVLLGTYDAHNNVASSSRGKWEDGEYKMLDKNTRYTHPNKYEKDGETLQDSSDGRYGEGGIYRAESFKETNSENTRSGMAVHAGREYKSFKKRVTMGCIRTTPEGMEGIDNAIAEYGSLYKIIVQNNHGSANSSTVNNIKVNNIKVNSTRIPFYKELFKAIEVKRDNTYVKIKKFSF